MLIVVAWLVDDVELVERRRDDLGERHITRAIKSPRSVTWLLKGTQEDAERAQLDADRVGLGGKVFTFSVNKANAHTIAERAMMKRAQAQR